MGLEGSYMCKLTLGFNRMELKQTGPFKITLQQDKVYWQYHLAGKLDGALKDFH